MDAETTFCSLGLCNLSLTIHLDPSTNRFTKIVWSNKDDVTYILQVFNEATKGRYNYRLGPSDELSDLTSFISAPRDELFFRIVGSLPADRA